MATTARRDVSDRTHLQLAANVVPAYAQPAPKVVDIDGAAEYLATTRRHIQRLQWERRLPFVKIGRKVGFLVADLDQFLESNRTPAVEQ